MRVSYLCNFPQFAVDEFGEGSRTGQSDLGIAPPSLPSSLSLNQVKIYDMAYSSANLSFERVGERPARPKGRRVTTSQDAAPWARFSAETGGVDFCAFCFGEALFVLQSFLSSSGLPPMRAGWSRPFRGDLEDRMGDLRFAVCNRSDLKPESPGNGAATA